MKKVLVLGFIFLATGCQLKGGDPVVTTTGKVPVSDSTPHVALITWGASTGTVTGYKIEASKDNVSFVELGAVDGGGGGTVAVEFKTGGRYYFRVRAYNQGGNSDYTATSTADL